MTDRSGDRVQEGVFFRAGERPPPCWRLLLLNFSANTKPAEARGAIAAIMQMLAELRTGEAPELRTGEAPELRGKPTKETSATRDSLPDLTALIGYGRSLFDAERHKPSLTTQIRPDFLAYLPNDSAFPAVPWAKQRANAEADLALQITGRAEATVNRGAVEIWKLIEDNDLPLVVAGTFSGFGRSDGRGWLEFHDGVANMASGQRHSAIEAVADPPWMEGGTYMAFLRLRVDLVAWRKLSRSEQELVVGRDKLSGKPLVAVKRDAAGRALPVAAATADAIERADPSQTTDPLLEASHVHRANQNRASGGTAAGLRIFRQGYEFLESIGPTGPELGLNFVSFQSELGVLQQVMRLPGWLGDVNFGGPTSASPGEPRSPELISLLCGGFYAVPPKAEPFPGAELFDGTGLASG